MDGRTADQRRGALLDGLLAESLVAERLGALGWTIVARNWSGGGGELDIVAVQDARLRFVEVKARSDADARSLDADGLDAIGPYKRARLVRAAEAFLLEWGRPVDEVAFLVALVRLPGDGARAAPEVEWIDNAFDA